MTVSPTYQSKGVFNPYYEIDNTIDRIVLKKLKQEYEMLKTEIVRYKCIDKPKRTWKNIHDVKGKFIFGIEFFDTTTKKKMEVPFYINLPVKNIKAHYGTPSRKDSTASSNVNEFLSLFFLEHKYTNAKDFMKMITKEKGGTGVYTGEENEVTFSDLKDLVDKDETPVRDIEIGYKNAIAVKADLKDNKQKYDKLYWTPRKKPGGIHKNNPSDVIVLTKEGCYVGYSNKISEGGKDATPKFNTNLFAFFGKIGDNIQQTKSVGWMNDSWKTAVESLNKRSVARRRIELIDITKELPSESSSAKTFAKIAKFFKTDGLDFYKQDFYYKYRENLIHHMMNHLSNKKNLVYFLNTISFYTFGVSVGTPCPYKLLVGRPNGASTIKEITKNEEFRELLENENANLLKKIKTNHVKGTQNFEITFEFFHYKINIPITVRTRAAGGWSGKALYITSSGIIMTK
tara:strand:- start:63 stop:1433 length:1371 start_codon:yes stop_codon:yes gene_type:complete